MKKSLLIFASAVLAIAGIAACVPHGPVVVGAVSLTSQSSSISATTIYTPADDGDFLVTAYAALPVTNPVDGDASVHALWSDEFRSKNVQVADANSGGYSVGGSYVIHATSGNPIQYSVTWGTGGTSTSYDVFVTVTKLQ